MALAGGFACERVSRSVLTGAAWLWCLASRLTALTLDVEVISAIVQMKLKARGVQ